MAAARPDSALVARLRVQHLEKQVPPVPDGSTRGVEPRDAEPTAGTVDSGHLSETTSLRRHCKFNDEVCIRPEAPRQMDSTHVLGGATRIF